VKSARPVTSARRRPTWSAQRPAGISTAANTIVYALRTHERESRPIPGDSCAIEGNARLTMKRSRLDMNTAMASTATIGAVPPFARGPATDDGDVLPRPMSRSPD
jgi:hypothetical protein